jgi:ankyrin repeat protein
MRKGYTKFVNEDFEECPVWELQHSLTTAGPYKGKVPFKADPCRAFFVRTKFTLADKTKMTGWVMVCVPPYEVYGLSPTILTDAGPVDLTKLAKQPKQRDVEEAFRRIGKSAKEMFPLEFESDVPVPKGPAKGEMKGFLHRLCYEDDKGWPQHLDIFYQAAAEVNSAVRRFNEMEAARKAALDPSKEEKAMLKAAKLGDLEKLRSLLAKGTNVNCMGIFEHNGYTQKKVTPLMLAAEAGQGMIVQALLSVGADVHFMDETNEPRQSGKTALAYACRAGQIETAQLLLKAGADANHRLSFGQTIFDEACYDGGLELIPLLLASGADPNASCGKCDYFALNRAVSAGRLDVVRLLIQHKADINGLDDDDETALIHASGLLRHEIVQFLLEKGADVGAKTLGKATALHRAVSSAVFQNPDYDKEAEKNFFLAMQIVRALVQNGADVNAVTKYGDTPLSLTKDSKFPELAEYLVSKGAK